MRQRGNCYRFDDCGGTWKRGVVMPISIFARPTRSAPGATLTAVQDGPLDALSAIGSAVDHLRFTLILISDKLFQCDLMPANRSQSVTSIMSISR